MGFDRKIVLISVLTWFKSIFFAIATGIFAFLLCRYVGDVIRLVQLAGIDISYVYGFKLDKLYSYRYWLGIYSFFVVIIIQKNGKIKRLFLSFVRYLKREFRQEDLILLSLIVAAFFLNALILINLPGLQEEEAFIVQPAILFVKEMIIKVEADTLFTGGGIFGVLWGIFTDPQFLMTNHFVGPVCWLVLVPFLKVLGTSVVAIRGSKMFYGLLLLVVFYLFAKKFSNRKVALVSCLLLSTMPYYIAMYSRGYLDDGLLPIFMLISLLSFYSFYKNKKMRYMYIGAFFTGIGLLTKLNFLFYVVALICTAWIFGIKPKITLKNASVALAIFLIGCGPLIFFNYYAHSSLKDVQRWGDRESTIEAFKNNALMTDHGENNLNLFGNVNRRVEHLSLILSDNQPNWEVNGFPNIFNPLLFPLLLVSTFMIMLGWYSKDKRIKFLCVLFFIMFFENIFTVSLLRVEHLTIILPLAILFIAMFLHDFFYSKNLKKIFYLTIAILITINLTSLYTDYYVLEKEGNIPRYFLWTQPSDAIYSLADYLVENNISTPIAIGPVLNMNTRILTDFKTIPQRCFLSHEKTDKSCIDFEGYYITSIQRFNEPFIKNSEEIFKRYNKEFYPLKVFYSKGGTPEIVIGELRDTEI